MKPGLADLIDPCLLPLVEGSRAFYANRVAARAPSSWEDPSRCPSHCRRAPRRNRRLSRSSSVPMAVAFRCGFTLLWTDERRASS